MGNRPKRKAVSSWKLSGELQDLEIPVDVSFGHDVRRMPARVKRVRRSNVDAAERTSMYDSSEESVWKPASWRQTKQESTASLIASPTSGAGGYPSPPLLAANEEEESGAKGDILLEEQPLMVGDFDMREHTWWSEGGIIRHKEAQQELKDTMERLRKLETGLRIVRESEPTRVEQYAAPSSKAPFSKPNFSPRHPKQSCDRCLMRGKECTGGFFAHYTCDRCRKDGIECETTIDRSDLLRIRSMEKEVRLLTAQIEKVMALLN